MVDIQQKKDYLNWFMAHSNFSRREILWVLNYIASHDTILEHVHFIEHVDKTPRGIRFISADFEQASPIAMFINGRIFVDVDQIFHEIRLNWKKELYLETSFPRNWEEPNYVTVLEDNPYASWNDSIDKEVVHEIDEYLIEAEAESKLKAYYEEIDLALANGDEDEFLRLSEKIKELNKMSN